MEDEVTEECTKFGDVAHIHVDPYSRVSLPFCRLRHIMVLPDFDLFGVSSEAFQEPEVVWLFWLYYYPLSSYFLVIQKSDIYSAAQLLRTSLYLLTL